MKTKSLVNLLLLFTLMLTFSVRSVSASEEIDLNRKGTIEVSIKTAEGEMVPKGDLSIYKVADVIFDEKGNPQFSLTETFENWEGSLDGLETEDPGAHRLAQNLFEYMENKDAAGTTVPVGEDGKAVFSDLSVGLYLFIQGHPAEGYTPISPFLCTLPFWDGEKYLYEFDAYPKPGTSTEIPTKPTEPTEPTETTPEIPPGTPPVVVTGDTNARQLAVYIIGFILTGFFLAGTVALIRMSQKKETE